MSTVAQPYAHFAPTAPEGLDPKVRRLALAQKALIASFLLPFVAGVPMVTLGLKLVPQLVSALFSLIALGTCVVGTIAYVMMIVGIDRSVPGKLFLAFLSCIPFVNIIALVVLMRAVNQKLRAAGLSIGLLGAKGLSAS